MTIPHHLPIPPLVNTSSCHCQTLSYARALQYWVENAQLPIPGKPHHLAESVLELWWVMEPLVSFTDEDILVATAPCNWVEVNLPRLAEPTPPDTQHSHSCNTQACPRGSLSAAHSGDQPTATMRRDRPATPPQEVMLWQLEHKSSCPLPRFAENHKKPAGRTQSTDSQWCPSRRS